MFLVKKKVLSLNRNAVFSEALQSLWQSVRRLLQMQTEDRLYGKRYHTGSPG